MANPAAPWRLFGLALPAGVWAAHFVVVYSLQGLTCAEGWNPTRATAALLLLTALALALIAWLGVRARRVARACRGDDADTRRRRFTAHITTLVAVLSTVAVLFTAIPIVLLSPCA